MGSTETAGVEDSYREVRTRNGAHGGGTDEGEFGEGEHGLKKSCFWRHLEGSCKEH